MVAESWFRSLWKTSKKHEAGPEKAPIGVLAFEVASLMSKLVHLWHSLSDKQVNKSREEIMNSVGIRKLVSDDDDYIVGLICAEMIDNLEHVAIAVARLAKKCTDPYLKTFENAFGDLTKTGADPYKWLFSWKKMDRKVKKMERFVLVNANLYQEVETLSELEQILRRMKGNADCDGVTLVDYEKKVAWKYHEVKHLKEISLWNRTYNYIVRLLARSVFTVFSRIGHVIGFNHVLDGGSKDSGSIGSDYIHHSRSVSTVLMQSSDQQSVNMIGRFSSGPLGNMSTKSGSISRTNKINNFHSGPLGNSVTSSTPVSVKHRSKNFYSGPLGRLTTKSGPLLGGNKTIFKLWPNQNTSNTLQGKGTSTFEQFKAPFRGADIDLLLGSDISLSSPKNRLRNAPQETLGAAALALHYANVIIVIEKLAASPHLIGHDARDDLYNMLPKSVRNALRARLKPYSKSLASSVYDTVLAGEWTDAMSAILEWLAPLAHNTVRWQSERSFEHQNLLSKTNVLLVQTLYFANQEKTEATITELLVGLNYIWRFGRELSAKALLECDSGRTFDDSFEG
ncbi:hypothetical protein LguiA_031957 [Lonicera macranthoides]